MPGCGSAGSLAHLPSLRGQHGRCQIGNQLIPGVRITRNTSLCAYEPLFGYRICMSSITVAFLSLDVRGVRPLGALVGIKTMR